MRRRDLVVLAWCGLTLAACGSSSAPAATPTTPTPPVSLGPVTVSLSGTTQQLSVHGCSGDSHSVTVNDGDVAVRLVATTDPAGALSVQLCQGPNDTGVCSIKQQKILVGQTLTGVRVGAAAQVLKLLPHACVFTETIGPSPITYTVSLTYQQ